MRGLFKKIGKEKGSKPPEADLRLRQRKEKKEREREREREREKKEKEKEINRSHQKLIQC